MRNKTAFTPRTFNRAWLDPFTARAFCMFLRGVRISDTSDDVLERAADFVWRNGDEVESAVFAYSRRMHDLEYRYFTIDNYDVEGARRAMAAFALTAMIDGKGRGWATWYLRLHDRHTRIRDDIRAYGKSLIRAADLDTWNSLPETFTIYRGTTYGGETKQVHGTAWTLDEEIAMLFADVGPFVKDGATGAVYALQVKKEDILYFTNERNESEIILSPEYGGRTAELVEHATKFKAAA